MKIIKDNEVCRKEETETASLIGRAVRSNQNYDDWNVIWYKITDSVGRNSWSPRE